MEPVNLLALDGGGIRGVSELLILHEIMSRVKFDKKLAEIPRPCDYFHLIGGTSTGGLIALMLGRLRMSTIEALQAYNDIAEDVFSKRNRQSPHNDGTFKASTLEAKIQEEVAKAGLGERMIDSTNDNKYGKAFVCAMPAASMAFPRLFRTYEVRENASHNCMIWEAARATTAAPTFFERILIGEPGRAKEEFIDGALGHNNPAMQLLHEARAVYGDEAQLGCLVSLGTGHSDTIGLPRPAKFQKMLPTDLINVLKRIVTNCEETARTLSRLFKGDRAHYFRLSVAHGAEHISLEEWEKMGALESHTQAYMQEEDVSASIDKVVHILCRPGHVNVSSLTLRSICGVKSDAATTLQAYKPHKRRPPSSSLFIDRVKLLESLKTYFVERNSGSHHRREFLLHGTGGAGKTQLALKFAEECEDRFSHIFWADASSKQTLEQSYKEIALRMDPKLDQTCPLDIAMRRIECHESEWLLLFDGADEPDRISTIWPPGVHGNILYTSKNPMLRSLTRHQKLEIGDLTREEAISLLLKAAQLEDTPEHKSLARQIVTELHFLALAVDQAGAYIANGQCSIYDFMRVFKEHRQDLLRNDAYRGASSYDKAVYATFDLSYRAILKTANTGHEASRTSLSILDIFAFFHYEDVSEDMFKLAAEMIPQIAECAEFIPYDTQQHLFKLNEDDIWESYSFRQGAQVLLSYSLISRDVSSTTLSMHRLVHSWALDRLSQREQSLPSRIAMLILELSAYEAATDDDFMHFRLLIPHITTFIRRATASVRTDSPLGIPWLAVPLHRVGMYKEAEEFLLEVLEVKKRVQGDEHPSSLWTIQELSQIYQHQGRLKEAKQLSIQLLRIRRRTVGDQDSGTLFTMHQLASIYNSQGRLDEAEKLSIQVLETSKRILEDQHPDTLNTMHNLASIYLKQERLDKAEKLSVQVLETSQQLLGHQHPDTLMTMHNLASTYLKQERLEEAEKVFVQVLASRRRILGDQHPDTLSTMHQLASTYRKEERLDEAEKVSIQAFDSTKRVRGDQHPDTLSTMHQLASIYRKQERLDEAEKLLIRVFDSTKRILGDKHPKTLKSMHLLAKTYHFMGKKEDALGLMMDVSSKRERLLGPDHPKTKGSLAYLEKWRA